MDVNECFFVKFKFGGYWTDVKGQNRKRYEGGRQKSMKLEIDKINISSIRDQIEVFCPWLKGSDYELHYYINGTSPKAYMSIKSDIDVIDMLNNSVGSHKIELLTTVQADEGTITTTNVQSLNENQCLELSHSCAMTGDINNLSLDDMGDKFLLSQNENNNSIVVGARYEDFTIFKNALRTSVILNNFAVKIKASDKKRVIATCGYRGCPWRVRASLCSDGHSFEVRKLDGRHICLGVNMSGNTQATSNWVAHQIKDIVKKNPDITPKHISDNLETTFGLSLPYMKLWRSREEAREVLFGSIDDNYSWVPTLRSELINRNPGSHIIYTYESHDNSFKRFYVSFKVCCDGFIAGCRPLIGVDACHLKSKYLGVLLSANCLDGNNGLFTIAFAVAESESKSS